MELKDLWDCENCFVYSSSIWNRNRTPEDMRKTRCREVDCLDAMDQYYSAKWYLDDDGSWKHSGYDISFEYFIAMRAGMANRR